MKLRVLLIFCCIQGSLVLLMLFIAVGTAIELLSSSEAADRSPAVVREFRKTHRCPSTERFNGACPGWVVDHMYPLCAGGKDEVANMMWQDTKQSFVKDRIERELCACKHALEK